MIAASLSAPTTIRAQAEKLQHDGLLTQDQLSDEELLTACQWMGIGQNLEVRERVTDNRKLLKSQRVRLAQALWESTHPEQMNELFRARRENSPRFSSLMNEQVVIRAKLAAAVSDRDGQPRQALHAGRSGPLVVNGPPIGGADG